MNCRRVRVLNCQSGVSQTNTSASVLGALKAAAHRDTALAGTPATSAEVTERKARRITWRKTTTIMRT